MSQTILKILPNDYRHFGVDFAPQPEITSGGETLTGTPTVTIDDSSGLTISSITISGNIVAFWLLAAANISLTDREVTVKVTTSGGAILNEVSTLQVRHR